MNSKTLTLSMKIPLKPGMGIDGLIPFGQRNCRGPKKCQIFRLLNSEDLLSVSQSDPDGAPGTYTQVFMCYF